MVMNPNVVDMGQGKLAREPTLIWDRITLVLISIAWISSMALFLRAKDVESLSFAASGTLFIAALGIGLTLMVNYNSMTQDLYSVSGEDLDKKEFEVGIIIVFFAYLVVIIMNFFYVSSFRGVIASAVSKGDALILTMGASVNEELFFRTGLLVLVLKLFPDYNDPVFAYFIAIPIVAVIFSGMHFAIYASAFSQPRVYLFILGYACGAAFYATKRPWVAMSLHLLNNAIVVLLVV